MIAGCAWFDYNGYHFQVVSAVSSNSSALEQLFRGKQCEKTLLKGDERVMQCCVDVWEAAALARYVANS